MFHFHKLKNAKIAEIAMLFFLLIVISGIFLKASFPLLDEIRILIVLWSVIFIPGIFLFGLFFNKGSDFDCIDILPVFLCLGLCFWALPAFIGFNFRLSVNLFVLLEILLIAAYLIWKLRLKQAEIKLKGALSSGWPLWVFIASSFFFSFMVFLSARFHRIDFDTFFHIASMQKIAAGGRLDGYTDPFTGMATLAPYINNLWFFIVGLISYISHIEVVKIYPMLAGVLSLCAITTFYTFVKHIFKDTNLAVSAGLLFIGFWFLFAPFWDFNLIFFKNLFFVFLPYPADLLCLIILPMAAIFYLRFILSGDKVDMFVSGLLSLAVATLHVSFIFYLGLVFASLLLTSIFCKSLTRQQINSYFLLAFILLIVVMFTCIIKIPMLKSTSNYLADMTSLKSYVTGRVGYWEFGKYLVMPDPVWYAKKSPWSALALLALVVLFLKIKGRDKFRVVFLAIGLVFPLLLLFNPVLAPFLSEILTVTVYRRIGLYSHQMFFFVALFSGMAILFTSGRPRQPILKRDLRALFSRDAIIPIVFILSCVGMFTLTVTKKVYFNALTNNKNFVDIQYIGQEPLFDFLKNSTPLNATIAANPDYAYLISSVTGRKVITIMTTRMSDYKEADRRTEDNRRIIEFDGKDAEIMQLLQKYNCQYIVLNNQDKALGRYKSTLSSFALIFDFGEWIVFKRII